MIHMNPRTTHQACIHITTQFTQSISRLLWRTDLQMVKIDQDLPEVSDDDESAESQTALDRDAEDPGRATAEIGSAS